MAAETWIDESPVGPVVRPPVPSGTAVLYLHGDRGLRCVPEAALDRAGELALRTGASVFCARYGPVFPGALDDARAAYEHCRHAGSPVVVAGERLGAGLAVALLTRLRDSGVAPPAGATLDSALLDLDLRAASLWLNAAADLAFDFAELRRRAARYAAGTAPTDPLLSPLHANLHGLPPVQLLAAGTDPLLDDSLAFAARAARSGVTVDLRVQPDAGALRQAAAGAMAAFIRARRSPRSCSVPG